MKILKKPSTNDFKWNKKMITTNFIYICPPIFPQIKKTDHHCLTERIWQWNIQFWQKWLQTFLPYSSQMLTLKRHSIWLIKLLTWIVFNCFWKQSSKSWCWNVFLVLFYSKKKNLHLNSNDARRKNENWLFKSKLMNKTKLQALLCQLFFLFLIYSLLV